MFALAASHSQLVIMKFLNEDKKMSVSDQQSGMELAACYGETLALDYLISLGIFNGNDIGMALDLAGEDVSIPVLVKLLPFIPFMYSGKVLNNLAKREQETKLAVLLYMVQDLPEEFKNKAFLEAAKNNNPKNMNVLLSKDLFLEHSCQLQEAFIEAIINDHADVVEVVLDLLKLKGFESVDLKDEFKLAVKGNCVGVARLLLQRGGIEKELVAAECVKIEEGSDLRGVLEAFCSSST